MIIAADNLTGANPVVAQALRDLDPAPIQDLARRCAAAGARVLDLNPGYLSRRLEDRMAFMVTAVQEVTTLPLILDSPNPRVLAGGLAVSRDRPILNAVTLEEHKLEEILPPGRGAPDPGGAAAHRRKIAPPAHSRRQGGPGRGTAGAGPGRRPHR